MEFLISFRDVFDIIAVDEKGDSVYDDVLFRS